MARRWWVGGVVALVAGLALAVGRFSAPAAAAADPPMNMRPFEGKAAKVYLKGREGAFLEGPVVGTIGNQPCVVGRTVGGFGWVWYPISEISSVEEFKDVTEMGKVYKLPGAAAK
jgi:hypothetical protein